MEFNKETFWSTILLIILVFLGTWLLATIIKPIFIGLILSAVIIVMKNKTLISGIKYYWKKLLDIIFKK